MTDSITAQDLVRRLWQYCNVLRDDGLSYPDYVEQLTYLLFLKMAGEQPRSPIPAKYSWPTLTGLSAEQTRRHYGAALAALGRKSGMLGLIFRDAKNKITDPHKLHLLINELIGKTEWRSLSGDLKGDAYEGLLEKNAQDTKSGAGQYFTPRPLIDALVTCLDPHPGEVVCDPACGTGGFLLAANAYVQAHFPNLTRAQDRFQRSAAFRGTELVPEVARLAAMNLLLHGMAADEGSLPIERGDSLRKPPTETFDIVLTNPPFGIKSSGPSGGAGEETRARRPDFWVTTANKQLNFLQHIVSMLKPGGRAAVIVPDNVLYEEGAGAVVRRRLLETCNVTALLRLPTGLFYAQGVQAHALLFSKRTRRGKATPAILTYDFRTGVRFSVKTRPIAREDLTSFIEAYRVWQTSPRKAGTADPRAGKLVVSEVLATKDANLERWLTAERIPGTPASNESLEQISQAIADDLARALKHVAAITRR